MATGPGLFSDIGKKTKVLLTRDYISDQKFSVSTFSDTGVGITSSAVKTGGLSVGQVATIYTYNNALINVQLDTSSNLMTSLIITDVLPSTKTMASIMLPDYTSGKVEVQYFHQNATFTTAAAFNKNPMVDVSLTLGTPAISLGAQAMYDTGSGNFTKYTAAIGIAKPESCASVILGEKGDTVTASFLHHLNQAKTSAAVGEFTRKFSTNENTFTVGGSHAFDPLTTVKAKLDNHGKLGAVLQHQIIPKSILTLAGEIDTKALEKTPKLGIALALNP